MLLLDLCIICPLQVIFFLLLVLCMMGVVGGRSICVVKNYLIFSAIAILGFLITLPCLSRSSGSCGCVFEIVFVTDLQLGTNINSLRFSPISHILESQTH